MFTKAEIAKLPVADQEVLAQLELSKARHRQKLLAQARGLDWRSRYFPLYVFSVFLIFTTGYYFNWLHIQENPFILYLPIGMGFVFSIIYAISRSNRRLDALLELLDFDRKNQNEDSHAKEEKAG